MSFLERCPSYRESNKGNKQRQGPTLGVRFTEVSVLQRYSTVLCSILPNESYEFGTLGKIDQRFEGLN